MTEMRVVYSAVADRWEAFPVSATVVDVVDDDGVRLLLGVDGHVVGFAFDVDGDPGSRVEVLRRYLRMEPIEDRISAIVDVDSETLVELESRNLLVPTASVSSIVTTSRFTVARTEVGGIDVRVRFAWWFALWGIWFSVRRGDGLLLADRPVPRRARPEPLPNAFPVRPDDLRVALHRGPRTARRMMLAVVAVVLVAVFVVRAGATSRESQPVATVPVTTMPSSTASDPSTTPTITLAPGREPGSDYVSTDGVARLDVSLATESASAGESFDVSLAFDQSAINTFGALGPGGDQTEPFRSCQSNLGLYRDVPPQPGATAYFVIQLTDADGVATPLAASSQQLTLVGAMVEGCPAPVTSGTDPYRVLQRTFYEPLTVPVTVPSDLAPGTYSLSVAVGAFVWSTTGDLLITIR